MVSDIVLLKELPESIMDSVAAYTACIAGAAMKEDYLASIRKSGLQEVEIISTTSATSAGIAGELADLIVSINVHAVKPH